jgi:hypothetical protein
MSVIFDAPEEFANYFSDISIVESGFQFFGLNRANDKALYADYPNN